MDSHEIIVYQDGRQSYILLCCSHYCTDMLIFVRTWPWLGNAIPLTVRASDTIETVKDKVETVTEMPLSDQRRLTFAGKSLLDGHTVSDYGICDGSTIHLDLRFRSGGMPMKGTFSSACMICVLTRICFFFCYNIIIILALRPYTWA